MVSENKSSLILVPFIGFLQVYPKGTSSQGELLYENTAAPTPTFKVGIPQDTLEGLSTEFFAGAVFGQDGQWKAGCVVVE